MTDTTNTKPMWKRCKGCNQRVFNDPIDWEGHNRFCPEKIRTDLNDFIEDFNKLRLADRVDAIEEIDTTPAADPYAVEDDTTETPTTAAAIDPFAIEPDLTTPSAPPTSGFTPGYPAIDRDDTYGFGPRP